MAMARFSDQELYSIRTDISILEVVEKLLELPTKRDGKYFRFLCPVCSEFQTAVNLRSNLCRCFRCERNFNTIELVMSDLRLSFVASVKLLKQQSVGSLKLADVHNLNSSSQNISSASD